MSEKASKPLNNQEIGYINTLNLALRKDFGRKMAKLAIDGGFTCPNRDGTVGYGGCSFCSERGSGDNASTIDEQIRLLSGKWRAIGYIAYFQNYTNTYAPIKVLKERYEAVISDPRIQGLAIATRPDCLPHEVLDYLSELNERTYLWVELGLQTAKEETAESFGRGYSLECYDEAVSKLRDMGIRWVTHLMLGLPGESRQDMFTSLFHVLQNRPWGLKLHLLNLVKGSRLAEENPNYQPFQTPEEYILLVSDMLEYIPENVIMHRLSGDSPADILISPKWAYRKKLILDGIKNELITRKTCQGYRSDEILPSL